MSTKKSKILPIEEAGIKGAQIEEYQNDPSQFTLLSFQEDTDIKIISKSMNKYLKCYLAIKYYIIYFNYL